VPSTSPAQRGKQVIPSQFATSYVVTLTPLPCLAHLNADQRQANYRRLVGEIEAEAEAANRARVAHPWA